MGYLGFRSACTPAGGINHSDDRAGDPGREPLVDGTWVSFFAGAKPESQAAAAPAVPRGVWPGWKDRRPLRYVGCARGRFCGSIHSIEGVIVPSATCCCCKWFE